MQSNDDESKDETKCRNCLYDVKKGIRRCPYCGILNPTVNNKDIFTIIFGVIFVMSIYTYVIR